MIRSLCWLTISKFIAWHCANTGIFLKVSAAMWAQGSFICKIFRSNFGCRYKMNLLLCESGENLISATPRLSATPRISAHPQGPRI